MKGYTLKQLQEIIEKAMADQIRLFMDQHPSGLYEPVGYTLGMGGKRLRPMMVLLAFNLFSEKIDSAVPAALAVEIFHNFTLLHDDIMDKAEMRRNKPTVHRKFSENKAILSGDAMSFLAYQVLLKCQSENMAQLLDLFSRTAVEVCEGQQLDMDFEQRDDVTETEYLEMIRLKTAVLLGCCLEMGAILGNAGPRISTMLYNYGLNLGLAFQLQDDLLDTFGNEGVFGKKIGGDIVSNKKTFLLIKALENGDKAQKRELLEWIARPVFDAGEKITRVKAVFSELEIAVITRKKIEGYFGETIRILDESGLNEYQKGQLNALNNVMIQRNS